MFFLDGCDDDDDEDGDTDGEEEGHSDGPQVAGETYDSTRARNVDNDSASEDEVSVVYSKKVPNACEDEDLPLAGNRLVPQRRQLQDCSGIEVRPSNTKRRHLS